MSKEVYWPSYSNTCSLALTAREFKNLNEMKTFLLLLSLIVGAFCVDQGFSGYINVNETRGKLVCHSTYSRTQSILLGIQITKEHLRSCHIVAQWRSFSANHCLTFKVLEPAQSCMVFWKKMDLSKWTLPSNFNQILIPGQQWQMLFGLTSLLVLVILPFFQNWIARIQFQRRLEWSLSHLVWVDAHWRRHFSSQVHDLESFLEQRPAILYIYGVLWRTLWTRYYNNSPFLLMPVLCGKILAGNKNGLKPAINLKGIKSFRLFSECSRLGSW